MVADRPGAAEALPVHRHRRVQPALRRPRRDRRRAVGGAADRPGRGLRPGDARRARLADRPGRHQRLRRPAPAARHRPGPGAPSRRSTCSTTRSRPSTCPPTRGCARRCGRSPGRRDGHRRGPTGLDASSTPTTSSSSTTARSSARARTTSCSRRARRTSRSSSPSAAQRRRRHERRREDRGGEGGRGAPRPGERSAAQRPRPDGAWACPAEKSQNFGPSAKRLLGAAAARARSSLYAVLALAVGSVALSAIGPKILGRATDLIFAGVVGKQLPAGVTQRPGRRRAAGPGPGHLRRPASPAMSTSCPVQGIDFGAVGRVLLFVLALYVVGAPAAVGAGLDPHRRGQPHDLRAAARRRGQAEPAAAALLRQPAARRAAQPRHQRHRQRRAEPAADAEPAAHLAAHRRRDGRDDALDLAAAGAHRAGDDPDLDGGHRDDRQALAEALRRSSGRRTGELNGIVEETFTGHELVKVFGRQRRGAGVVRGEERRRCSRAASAPSSSAASSCRR